ncbi:MAG: DUF4340 domain-containing protein [Bacteroidia bacterium]
MVAVWTPARMRVNITLILFLLVLAVGVGVVWWGGWLAARRAEAERRFQFPDTANIVEIHLVEKHEDTAFFALRLVRRGGSWWIGDTLEAFMQPVTSLLQTLAQQMPRAPVASPAVRNVLEFLRSRRVEVTLYFRDGQKEVFYVGGPTPDQLATYMLRPGSSQPYEVFLPGLEGYLTPRYRPDLSAWQPNKIFAALAVELRAIQLDYFGKPQESWRLERLAPNGPWQLASGEALDSARLSDYLLAYSGPFYADDLVSPDSLADLPTFADMRLELWSGKVYHWSLYLHPNSPLHYYVRLWHSPYFCYVIGRYTMDRLLYRRMDFLRPLR